ncbi:MAG: glycosyl hydrolase 108 family protein [Rikenellaceae bacterium]
MADIETLAPFILSFEGGFVDHPNDRGGATNKGVTLSTWRSYGYDIDTDGDIDVEDLKSLSDREVIDHILRPHYWDRCRADEIQDQSIANMVVDWVWGSGAWGIKHTQQVLGLERDGVVGPKTLEALNGDNPEAIFEALKRRREQHFRSIVDNDPSQGVFLNGWLRRLECIGYNELKLNGNG